MSKQKWLTFGVTVALVFSVLFAACAEGREESPATVIAKAYSQTTAVQSYRYQERGASFQGSTRTSSIHKGEYLSPDRAKEEKICTTGTGGGALTRGSESINIGRKSYTREFCSDCSKQEGRGKVQWREQELPKPGVPGFLPGSLWYAEMLVDPVQLPDEEISGVRCWHYRGRMDMEKWLNKTHSGYEARDSEEEKASIEWYKKMDATMKLWIGQEDYLIRRMKVEQWNTPGHARREVNIPPEEDVFICFWISEYYDFNEPISIEPPE